MRRVLFILAVVLTQAALAASALAAPKILSKDGSLVIDTQGSKKNQKPGSEDTLYELLGQEVQVFIFNKKTRVWPQVYGHTVPTPFHRSNISLRDPQLEALISKYSQIYGVDPTLVRAIMRHESGFKSTAVSPKGAQGLMQLMPGTAALMGVKDPFDPEQNIAGGVGYLRHCLDRFQHNVPLAVAAYNAGPESVAKCGAIPPYQETRVFVNNVMGTYAGPNQMKPGAPNDPKAAAAPPTKPAKARKKDPKPENQDEEKTAEPRRRPHPKIIEVRSYKSKAKEVSKD